MSSHLAHPEPATLAKGDLLWPRDPNVVSLPTSLGELADWVLKHSVQAMIKVVDIALALLEDLTARFSFLAPLVGHLKQLRRWLTWEASPFGLWRWPPLIDGSVFDLLRDLDDFIRLYLAELFSIGNGANGSASEQATELDVEFGWLRSALGIEPGRATFFGLYVGHVGLVDKLPSGELWVVESSYVAGGAHMLPYTRWVAARRDIGAHVWHGRITRPGSAGVDAEALLEQAHLHRQLRRQYAIFDRDAQGAYAPLGDATYVYCSELVWMAARQLGIDLDTRTGLKLPFFGPRALAHSDHVTMLNEPGGKPY